MLNLKSEKEVKVIGLPSVPETTFKKVYKITVEEIEKRTVPEIDKIYVNEETGEVLTSSWNKKDGVNYQEVKAFMGSFEEETKTTKVYEQEVENFEVSELALHINRVR